MKYPWTNNMNGGTKKRNKKHTSPRPVINHDFSELWTKCKFKSMTAFGIRNKEGKLVWSINFKESKRLVSNRLYNAFVLTTDIDNYEQKLQELLVDEIRYHYSHKL